MVIIELKGTTVALILGLTGAGIAIWYLYVNGYLSGSPSPTNDQNPPQTPPSQTPPSPSTQPPSNTGGGSNNGNGLLTEAEGMAYNPNAAGQGYVLPKNIGGGVVQVFPNGLLLRRGGYR